MSEVLQWDLSAEIVALTACETGLGHTVSGEGVMAMSRAFQYAGVRSILASLWRVSKDSTTQLVVDFLNTSMKGCSSPPQ